MSLSTCFRSDAGRARQLSCSRRTRLATGILAGLLSINALAAGHREGTTHVVLPDDEAQAWTLAAGDQLLVRPDAKTRHILATEGSFVLMEGADADSAEFGASALALRGSRAKVINSILSSDFEPALSLAGGSHAWVQGGAIANVNGIGARVDPGSLLEMQGTLVLANGGQGVGVSSHGGDVVIGADTMIRGRYAAVEIRAPEPAAEGDAAVGRAARLLVSGADLDARLGSAIMVYLSNHGVANQARISIRDGSVLTAGNGRLLEVLQTYGQPEGQVDLDVASSSLHGDVVSHSGGTVNVTLGEGGRIDGAFTGVTHASLQAGGHWTLTGDSDVGALTVAAGGTVELGRGEGFHTLTVAGDYTGAGGTLAFTGALGDDGSASDRLHVKGDTHGDTWVSVANVGGRGGQTADGIRLVQVDGASLGDFSLRGRAVGGAYEYFLFKGGVAGAEGDWFLRSQLTDVGPAPEPDPVPDPEPDPVDPCEADPSAPGCGTLPPAPCDIDPDLPQCRPPVPVLRPELAAYLANRQAAVQLLQHRAPAAAGTGSGAWARMAGVQITHDGGQGQLRVRSDRSALHLGTDLYTAGSVRLGVSAASGSARQHVQSVRTGYAARGTVRGQALGVYGGWQRDDARGGGTRLGASLQYGQYRNRVHGDALPQERYQARTMAASLEVAHAFTLRDGKRATLRLEPQLQVDGIRYRGDPHVEQNGTQINASATHGVATRAGVRLHGVSQHGTLRAQPFLEAHWLQDARLDAMNVDDERVQGDAPDQRFELRAGVQLALRTRWQVWGDVSVQRGAREYREVTAQLGLRRGW